MRDTWLVKNYEHVLRRETPTDNDTFNVYPSAWIDIVTDTAYMRLSTIGWLEKAPDKIILTPSNSIFVIETIGISETVTMKGETVTISGEEATW